MGDWVELFRGFFPPSFLLCPSPGVVHSLCGAAVSEVGCSIFRTVFLSPLCSFCITWQSRGPWQSSCQALQCLLSTARLECQGSQGRAVGVEQGMLCAPTGGRSVVLSLGASMNNWGSKTGSCFKNRPWNGGRSASGREHSRRGRLSCAPPSSVLKPPGWLLYGGLSSNKEIFLLSLKWVALGSCGSGFLLVLQVVMRFQCLLGGGETLSSQDEPEPLKHTADVTGRGAG